MPACRSRKGERARHDAVPVDHVPRQRRRSRSAPARTTAIVRPADGGSRGQRAGRFARKSPIIRPQKNPIEWRANVTQLANPDGSPVDGTDAVQLSAAEVEGRRQIVDFFQFLRESVPGFEQSYILEIAPQVGMRETRRIVGDYQLTESDVLDCASFDDTDRRQRLDDRGARGGRHRVQVAGHPERARLQPPALPDAAAAGVSTTCWWPAAADR